MIIWLSIICTFCCFSGLTASEEKCPIDGRLHYIPHETDCSSFYTCLNGNSFLKKCPENLHFNRRNLVCDFPESAKCTEHKGKTSFPKEKFVPLDDRIECPAEDNPRFHMILPHPTDCEKYFLCSNGVSYGKVCPAGLHFSYILQKCDYPKKVRCDVGSSKIQKQKLGWDDKLTECPSENGVRPTLLPHLHDCGKFYTCDNGVPHPKSCQLGLHFNPKLQVCDYPERAGCDNKSSLLPVQRGPGVPSPFCPSVDRENQIFYIHPWNCSVYYLCAHGLAYEFTCPARLHFNLEKKACDYEWLAKCEKDDDEEEGGAVY